jgi:hypothetical protein
MPELRQRNTKDDHKANDSASDSDSDNDRAPKLTPSQLAKAEDSSFSWLDVARSLVFLLLLTGATSYFVTRESFVWNVSRPSWTRPDVIQAWLVCL